MYNLNVSVKVKWKLTFNLQKKSVWRDWWCQWPRTSMEWLRRDCRRRAYNSLQKHHPRVVTHESSAVSQIVYIDFLSWCPLLHLHWSKNDPTHEKIQLYSIQLNYFRRVQIKKRRWRKKASLNNWEIYIQRQDRWEIQPIIGCLPRPRETISIDPSYILCLSPCLHLCSSEKAGWWMQYGRNCRRTGDKERKPQASERRTLTFCLFQRHFLTALPHLNQFIVSNMWQIEQLHCRWTVSKQLL